MHYGDFPHRLFSVKKNISLPSVGLLTHLPASATAALHVQMLRPKHYADDYRLFHVNFSVWALL